MEVDALLPTLLEKSGQAKERFRVAIRALLTKIPLLCSYAKYSPLLLQVRLCSMVAIYSNSWNDSGQCWYGCGTLEHSMSQMSVGLSGQSDTLDARYIRLKLSANRLMH